MMENDTQNSQQAASTALHNAPKLAKIAQAGVQGGPAGAATEAAVQQQKVEVALNSRQYTRERFLHHG